VTIVSTGLLVGFCEAVADKLAAEGIGCDVIDLRTTSPLDEETILDSVEVTGRLVVVDEAPPRCSLATDICALVAEKAFASLKAPPRPSRRRIRRCPSRASWKRLPAFGRQDRGGGAQGPVWR
jgi:acetoin:2,6-dichlorophenolindophenol oxidoreductase subunit beta